MRIDLKEGVTFASNDPQGPLKLGIGLLVSCFSFLLLPILVLMGYSMETMRSVSDGEDNHLPGWDNLAALGYRGLMWLPVALAYLAVPVVLSLIGFGTSLMGMFGAFYQKSVATGATGIAAGGLFGIAGMLTGAVAYVFLPMAMLRYARNSSYSEAFDFSGILADIMKSPVEYLVALILPVVAAFAVSTVLAFIPLAGAILTQFVWFYSGLVTCHLIGQYYRAHLA